MGVTINMALLTEMGTSSSLKILLLLVHGFGIEQEETEITEK